MQAPKQPDNETERLQAVKDLGILDTPSEERFDRITRTACQQLHVPISTISIIDEHREWFKSCAGLTVRQGDRDVSFCGHTMVHGNIFIVADTLKDVRFADNPQVINPPHIRFYAGVALFEAKTHLPIGAFCIKDTKPRSMTMEELNTLMELAKEAEEEINRKP